ncbi:MAG: hypothetical protein KGQ60_16425 [Planctomycetes bacterium]|nr:hypothetical protein [Planctomycetota bacterium]
MNRSRGSGRSQMERLPPRLGYRGRYASMSMSPTWMFEVYYKPPRDPVREHKLLQVVSASGGRFDHRAGPHIDGSTSVCLTFEFDDFAAARTVGDQIRMLGEHVEGPYQYS